jgi:hypothetical protein
MFFCLLGRQWCVSGCCVAFSGWVGRTDARDWEWSGHRGVLEFSYVYLVVVLYLYIDILRSAPFEMRVLYLVPCVAYL